MNCIENLRRKNKVLTTKCRRYKAKIMNLKSLLVHLEQEKLISDDTGRMLNVSA